MNTHDFTKRGGPGRELETQGLYKSCISYAGGKKRDKKEAVQSDDFFLNLCNCIGKK